MNGRAVSASVSPGAVMPPTLRWSIERDFPYVVVRMTGTLSALSAPVARAGIAKCLATQPAAVIVDVAGLRMADPHAATVFLAAAREAARWPGTRLVLCRPDGAAAAALREGAATRHLTVFHSLEAAVAGIDEDAAPTQLSAHLMPAVGAARQSRALVTEACARWDLPAMVGPACTVVTELVNNVVAHAGTPMEVTIRLRGSSLHVSVRDDCEDPPEERGPVSPTAPGGRGLMMVAAVSQHWGFTPVSGGKVVWAVLRLDGER